MPDPPLKMTMFAKLLALGDPRRAVGRTAFVWITLVTVLLDQLTKLLTVLKLAPEEYVVLIPGCFRFWHRTNTGAAFSFAENHTGILTIFSAVISLIVIVWAWRLRPVEHGLRIPLGLILGGAIGNLIDRVRLGHVIDFLDVYIVWNGEHHWPTFNIADSAVCIGMALLILASFQATPPEEAPAATPEMSEPPPAKDAPKKSLPK